MICGRAIIDSASYSSKIVIIDKSLITLWMIFNVSSDKRLSILPFISRVSNFFLTNSILLFFSNILTPISVNSDLPARGFSWQENKERDRITIVGSNANNIGIFLKVLIFSSFSLLKVSQRFVRKLWFCVSYFNAKSTRLSFSFSFFSGDKDFGSVTNKRPASTCPVLRMAPFTRAER